MISDWINGAGVAIQFGGFAVLAWEVFRTNGDMLKMFERMQKRTSRGGIKFGAIAIGDTEGATISGEFFDEVASGVSELTVSAKRGNRKLGFGVLLTLLGAALQATAPAWNSLW